MDIPGWASAAGAAAIGPIVGSWLTAVIARVPDRPSLAARHRVTHLGMPDFRPAAGRSSGADGEP